MAGTLSVITGVIVAGSGATLMARLRGNAGQLVTQASLTSISYTVTDLTAGTVSSPVTVSVAACVFDNLQQGDPRWSKDSANDPGPDGEHGYNALVTVSASHFPATVPTPTAPTIIPAPHVFQVDVIFQPVTGEPFRVVWRLGVQQIFG